MRYFKNAVICDPPVDYTRYGSHHEEHEDHKGKTHNFTYFLRVLRGYGCATGGFFIIA